MTKQAFFDYCFSAFSLSPDYPFGDDSGAAVLRHPDSRRWFALVMRVPERKFGLAGDGEVDVVNLKLPPDMSGTFGAAEGVFPAYHMNKLHWVSVLLPVADGDLVGFLTRVSYTVTKTGGKNPGTKKKKDAGQ